MALAITSDPLSIVSTLAEDQGVRLHGTFFSTNTEGQTVEIYRRAGRYDVSLYNGHQPKDLTQAPSESPYYKYPLMDIRGVAAILRTA